MMNLNFERKSKISFVFLRVLIKILELDKKIRNYGTNEQLYEAEIHMIKAIKENESIHVTGLADLLGVTKGAVSQIIIKLERKGMIVKEVDPHNLSRLLLRVTPVGETAYWRHEELHQEFDNIFNDALANATEENKAFLRSFLTTLETNIDHYSEVESE
jgi:DNA-binding MarR family transcriptional regulator